MIDSLCIVPDQLNVPKEEEKVLEYWEKIDAFKLQLEKTKDLPPYTFYDGPPFATGLPHYGHLCAGTIKVDNYLDFFSHKRIRMLLLVMLVKLDTTLREGSVGIVTAFQLNMKLISNMRLKQEMMF